MLSSKTHYRHSDPAVFLIGPMGAGKSTAGQILASRLHADFVDTDSEIERRSGLSVHQIFESSGELRFRELETSLLEELEGRTGVVVATGGGTIVRQENRIILRKGTVVYLQTSTDRQYARVKNSTHRPLLDGEDPVAALAAAHQAREPLYRSEADIIVSTDERSAQVIAHEIERALMLR